MQTEMWTVDFSDEVRDPYADVIGCRAVFTTYEGERLVGTLERPKGATSATFPHIRFDDGRWARADETIEIVI